MALPAVSRQPTPLIRRFLDLCRQGKTVPAGTLLAQVKAQLPSLRINPYVAYRLAQIEEAGVKEIDLTIPPVVANNSIASGGFDQALLRAAVMTSVGLDVLVRRGDKLEISERGLMVLVGRMKEVKRQTTENLLFAADINLNVWDNISARDIELAILVGSDQEGMVNSLVSAVDQPLVPMVNNPLVGVERNPDLCRRIFMSLNTVIPYYPEPDSTNHDIYSDFVSAFERVGGIVLGRGKIKPFLAEGKETQAPAQTSIGQGFWDILEFNNRPYSRAFAFKKIRDLLIDGRYSEALELRQKAGSMWGTAAAAQVQSLCVGIDRDDKQRAALLAPPKEKKQEGVAYIEWLEVFVNRFGDERPVYRCRLAAICIEQGEREKGERELTKLSEQVQQNGFAVADHQTKSQVANLMIKAIGFFLRRAESEKALVMALNAMALAAVPELTQRTIAQELGSRVDLLDDGLALQNCTTQDPLNSSTYNVGQAVALMETCGIAARSAVINEWQGDRLLETDPLGALACYNRSLELRPSADLQRRRDELAARAERDARLTPEQRKLYGKVEEALASGDINRARFELGAAKKAKMPKDILDGLGQKVAWLAEAPQRAKAREGYLEAIHRGLLWGEDAKDNTSREKFHAFCQALEDAKEEDAQFTSKALTAIRESLNGGKLAEAGVRSALESFVHILTISGREGLAAEIRQAYPEVFPAEEDGHSPLDKYLTAHQAEDDGLLEAVGTTARLAREGKRKPAAEAINQYFARHQQADLADQSSNILALVENAYEEDLRCVFELVSNEHRWRVVYALQQMRPLFLPPALQPFRAGVGSAQAVELLAEKKAWEALPIFTEATADLEAVTEAFISARGDRALELAIIDPNARINDIVRWLSERTQRKLSLPVVGVVLAGIQTTNRSCRRVLEGESVKHLVGNLRRFQTGGRPPILEYYLREFPVGPTAVETLLNAGRADERKWGIALETLEKKASAGDEWARFRRTTALAIHLAGVKPASEREKTRIESFLERIISRNILPVYFNAKAQGEAVLGVTQSFLSYDFEALQAALGDKFSAESRKRFSLAGGIKPTPGKDEIVSPVPVIPGIVLTWEARPLFLPRRTDEKALADARGKIQRRAEARGSKGGRRENLSVRMDGIVAVYERYGQPDIDFLDEMVGALEATPSLIPAWRLSVQDRLNETIEASLGEGFGSAGSLLAYLTQVKPDAPAARAGIVDLLRAAIPPFIEWGKQLKPQAGQWEGKISQGLYEDLIGAGLYDEARLATEFCFIQEAGEIERRKAKVYLVEADFTNEEAKRKIVLAKGLAQIEAALAKLPAEKNLEVRASLGLLYGHFKARLLFESGRYAEAKEAFEKNAATGSGLFKDMARIHLALLGWKERGEPSRVQRLIYEIVKQTDADCFCGLCLDVMSLYLFHFGNQAAAREFLAIAEERQMMPKMGSSLRALISRSWSLGPRDQTPAILDLLSEKHASLVVEALSQMPRYHVPPAIREKYLKKAEISAA